MAQYLTYSQARDFEIDGKNYDLIGLVEALERTPDGWVSPATVADLTVGQIVHVWALGDRLRRGVVAKLGRTKAVVVFTTKGAVDESVRYAEAWGKDEATIRVADTAVQLSQIHYPAPAAPVEEPAADPNQCPVCQFGDRRVRHTTPTGQECAHQPEPSEAEKRLIEEPAEDLTLDSQDCKVDPESKDDEPEGDEMSTETTTEVQATEKIDAPAPPVQTGDMMGSAVVTLLEEVWDRIRENHPELPAVVIVTGSGMIGPSRWGHFRAEGWKLAQAKGEEAATDLALGEMFMAGETLAKGARQVLQTMLHEAAHVLARVRDLKDTSRQGRWHNGTFRTLAEEMGLQHKQPNADSAHGFSFVTLTEQTEAKYADLLDGLDREIRLVVDLPWFLKGTERPDGETEGGEYIHGGRKVKTTTTPQSGNLKATCLCAEPNIIRLSRKVLDLEVVRCDECSALFTTE